MKRKIPRVISSAVLSLALPLGLLTAVASPARADHDPAHDWNNFEKITLTKNVGEPIDLAVLPDGRVLHTTRPGEVRVTDPRSGVTRTVNALNVYTGDEDGLQTVTLDPDFETNNWVYLYYAPRLETPSGTAPQALPAGADEATYWQQWQGYNQLSRFKWTGSELDLSTEQQILRVPVDRGQCCHVAGDVDFDAQGNLYLATGDDTPSTSPNVNGYNPTNDSPNVNPAIDARRGASNTNDLRGKILRIKVNDDGSYAIPSGNLFAPGTERTRPEVFIMGVRNPFRMYVDDASGAVIWADNANDVATDSPTRGPQGIIEWNMSTQPHNGGWPFCIGPNRAFNDFNYVTVQPGPFYDCNNLRNTSRWNTGLTEVPPSVPADLWYGHRVDDQPWPEFKGTPVTTGGQSPMAGPVYHYDAANPSQTKFPAYYDGKAFFAEFTRDYALTFALTDSEGGVSRLEDFLPNADLSRNAQPLWDNVMDMEFGPDGSLYVLEYGDAFFAANTDAGLYRVDYAPGNKTPQARIVAQPTSGGNAPLTVSFSGGTSSDPEGGALAYEWDFDGDGTFDAAGATASHTYAANAQYQARLRVTDPSGKFGITSQEVTVGNTAPTVSLNFPADGGFFDWGDGFQWQINATDPEDAGGCVNARANWSFALGHGNTHAHGINSGTGCQGTVRTSVDSTHGETENIYGAFGVSFRDPGANGVPAATGAVAVTLNPKQLQAEHADASSGVQNADDPTASGLGKTTSFDAGDHLAYDPVNFQGINGVQTVASGAGTLSLRWNSATAEPFATIAVSAGAGWQTVNTALADLPTGTGRLYVTSSGGVELDVLRMQGVGIADKTAPTVNAATLNPAEPTGQNGWYTGQVVMNISGVDDGVGTIGTRQYQFVANGAACNANIATPWTNAPGSGNVTLTTAARQGTNNICYRVADAAGNVSAPRLITVRIDSSAPTATLPGVVNGTIDDAQYLVPAVTDSTGGSGNVTVVSMTLDGNPVSPAAPLNLASLSLGTHTLVLVSRDAAGNTGTSTLTFTVTVTFDSVQALIDRYATSKAITPSTAAGLLDRLGGADRQASLGREGAAVGYLEQFIARVSSQVRSAAARALLTRDAQALIEQLEA